MRAMRCVDEAPQKVVDLMVGRTSNEVVDKVVFRQSAVGIWKAP